MPYYIFIFFLLLTFPLQAVPKVKVGIDLLMEKEQLKKLNGKKIGLLTNHTGVDSRMRSTLELLRTHTSSGNYSLAAIFAPEHGINGSGYANEHIDDLTDLKGVPIYSLHGTTRRPTPEMLKGLNLIIYDIQDLGSRSYTYSTTLFYTMEAAAAHGVEVMVLDRPNPINGLTIDGPMLSDQLRSMVGYINVPYCHGMTIGELAHFFNEEYHIGCKLTVIPMRGWERAMSFQDTGLAWIPTSPQIPEASTAFYYPTTGILGELSLVNIGVGYTLPFKIVGAPWIDAKTFAKTLNSQKFPGVYFEPFHYKPFYGKFAQEDCQGALIVITDNKKFLPVTTQYLILGILKSLYPDHFSEALITAQSKKSLFDKVNGTEEIYKMMTQTRHIVWPLRSFQQKEREQFRLARQKYLLY